ncbi:hypothetical protein FE236_05520 [Mariprofundus erugo]|uniref:hypothetical protein n=1 Tax=Mariprofundus erugo TaxID=2528639 RepID=UPI0010FDC1D0|nr:hypothetical protein [Mariprofundus erugo]TLS76909.1 hypothetical protein FE236_05520 [Mariprofundus erugo]
MIYPSNKRELFFYYADWVMSHPRFGMVMVILILSSFTHDHILAGILFTLFSLELSVRIPLHLRKRRQSSIYRASLGGKMESLLLGMDIIAVVSLLTTVFHLEGLIGDLALIRLVRGLYLLRLLRIFRYVDLQSMIYSPTYGIVISIIILVSFFAQGIALWGIIIFMMIELVVRMIIMTSTIFASEKDKQIEWVLWSIDVVATVATVPLFAGNPIADSLRLLRLLRVFRPWVTIFRNLFNVIKEGSFMQEVNLVLLLLAVLSIGAGVGAPLVLPDFDYNKDGVVNEADNSVFTQIWYAFRALTDPGNIVNSSDSGIVIALSIAAVVVGVFLFSFFIGIGVNIVEGLMKKLRNEWMNINDHIVMIGWNSASPDIVEQLQRLALFSYKQLKLVLLYDDEQRPDGFKSDSGVMFRWGHFDDVAALERVSVRSATHAIVNVPEHVSPFAALSYAFLAQVSLRRPNQHLSINCAIPSHPHPRLPTYRHALQVGWDNQDYYRAATSLISQAEVKANLFKQVMFYYDYDQVISLLMISTRHGSSQLHVVRWDGYCVRENNVCYVESSDHVCRIEMAKMVKALFKRGVILMAIADASMNFDNVPNPQEIDEIYALIGICADEGLFMEQFEYVIRHADEFSDIQQKARMIELTPLALKSPMLNVVIIGRIGSLPLILKRLLAEYEMVLLTILDDVSEKEAKRVRQRIYDDLIDVEGALDRISLMVVRWDFDDMEVLEAKIRMANRIFIAPPEYVTERPHAIVASIVSHVISILDAYESEAIIFPVVNNRAHARTLQLELHRFGNDNRVHVVVPGEFYGTYIAHTSFHMQASKTEEDFRVQRILHHVFEDLMSEAGEDDCFDLHGFKIEGVLEKDPQSLFNALLDQGELWIGYRLKSNVNLEGWVHNAIVKAFPREVEGQCVRQEQIVLNPFSSPYYAYIWEEKHDDIVELVAIRLSQSEEELIDDIFF